MSATPSHRIDIIYDGQCAFCQRALRVVKSLDAWGRFDYYDFHDQKKMIARFPALQSEDFADFEKAMYAIDSRGKTFRGFFAFRRLLWASPWTFLLAPLAYFPGVATLGTLAYAWIARHRSSLGCRL